MEEKKYAELVELLLKEGRCPHRALIEDYKSPACKAAAARFSMTLGKYEETIDLLKSVSSEDFEDLEQWIWVLKDLGYYYHKIERNEILSLQYFKEADKLAFSCMDHFNFLVRGEIWTQMLEAMLSFNKKEDVMRETRIPMKPS